jgi:hypothetical protein
LFKDSLTLNTNDPTVSFFALGDWGGSGSNDWTKAISWLNWLSWLPIPNTPTPTQVLSAQKMGVLSSQLDTKFQLGLGDNFYSKY